MLKSAAIQGIIGLLTIFVVLSSFQSPKSNKTKEKYLFKLGDKEYYEDEFRYYFFKNNDDLPKDSVKIKIEEYLDLYVKFRLKVQEAVDLKKDKDPGFIKEFNGYKSQLVKPYLMESKISESLIQETYERMKEERLASHILLKVSEDALPEDTLKVYNRLLDLKKRAGQGEDFGELAFQFSEDPSAKSNRGNLGYFSAMQMVYPFEEATFRARAGQLVGPVRTNFGYHLIHVKDIREARGKVQVAHIMIRSEKPGDESDEDISYRKIQSVFNKLLAGEDWDTLCKLHSEDFNTSKRGGAINWFGTGNIVKEFEDAAFALDTIGSISKPVKTNFGWHIIKLLGKKGLEPFEKVKPQLEKTLSRDERSRVKKSKALSAIKKEHGFVLNRENKKLALSKIDSSLLNGTWVRDSTSSDNSLSLFNLGSDDVTIGDLWEYVGSRQRKRTHNNLEEYKLELYNRFEEKSIFDFEEGQLLKTNFEYRMILGEYKSGILLFNLMEQKVWQKAVQDTVGQRAYYEKTKDNYIAKESAEVRIFVSDNGGVIKSSRSFLDSTKKEIDSVFNRTEPLNLQVSEKTVEKGEDEVVDIYWKKGLHEHIGDGKHYLINIKKINPRGIKKFENTKGAVISGYQDELENNWIDLLKSKYPVKVNKGTLKKIISKIEEEV